VPLANQDKLTFDSGQFWLSTQRISTGQAKAYNCSLGKNRALEGLYARLAVGLSFSKIILEMLFSIAYYFNEFR